MEGYGEGSSSGILSSSSSVPAFLVKLWTLVEDPDTDSLICWDQNGTTFHVFDQARFSKEVLPKYFKHNNMASFVRQLNMYGFRKVVHIEHGGLLLPDRDDTEFQHPYFVRGQAHLLGNIKRKVTTISGVKDEDIRLSRNDVKKLLTDAQSMRGKQESMDSRISALKFENEALWREIVTLRQKHSQQQKVVSKIIQFLLSLVRSKGVLGLKRKIPLMLEDSSTAHSAPKYSRQLSLEPVPGSSVLGSSAICVTPSSLTEENLAPEIHAESSPIISYITDLAHASPTEAAIGWTEETIPSVLSTDETTPVRGREEPVGPVGSTLVEEVGTTGVADSGESILSPTTFIDSILQENKPTPASQSQPIPLIPAGPDNGQNCLGVACLDKNELNEHLESIDSSLDNLQSVLNNQAITFDSSSLFEMFGPASNEFSLPDLDTNLSNFQDFLTEEQKAETDKKSADSGKLQVQYTAQPILDNPDSPDCSEGDMTVPLGEDAYYGNAEKTDLAASLLSNKH
ncbi:hypothetical protein GJAV_G00017240 [Gymnothorax javanicus]|nr:hypothetical protein GJAV_G00017240 [Gymnothorax javanicus]